MKKQKYGQKLGLEKARLGKSSSWKMLDLEKTRLGKAYLQKVRHIKKARLGKFEQVSSTWKSSIGKET